MSEQLKEGDRIFYAGKDWFVKEIHNEYLVVFNPKNPPIGGGAIFKIYFGEIRKVDKDNDGRDVVYI